MPQLRPRQTPGFRAVLAGFLAVLFIALALFGARFHWVEEAGTAERDGYVARAEEILAGELPRDPFRPLLYPLAVAGLARLGLPPFAAARLLSNAAAVALVALAAGLGGRLGGRRTAGWAAAATAVNPNVWILGQHASTDMLFGALGGAALLAAADYLERPRRAAAVAAGAAWAAAAFTRGSALFLLPALALAWLLARRPPTAETEAPPRARWSHLILAALVAAALLAPHWWLRHAAFGDAFHDENWKNLAWKLHGYPDWSYLERVPYGGPGDLLLGEPRAVVAGGLAELRRFFFAGGLAQLLGTPLHALLLLVGAAVAATAAGPGRRTARWLLAACGLFLAGVAFTFFTWGRLLLPLLPAGNALAFAVAGTPGRPWRRRWEVAVARRAGPAGRRLGRAAVPAFAAALVALLAVKTFVFRLPAFVARHPYVEVAAVEELDRTLPEGAVLGGTSPFLGRYVGRPYVALPDAFGAEVGDPALYFAHLRRFLHARGVDVLVAGRVDLRDRPPALVGEGPPPPWLDPLGRRDGVVVWRVE